MLSKHWSRLRLSTQLILLGWILLLRAVAVRAEEPKRNEVDADGFDIVHLQFVQCADDDGSRATDVTPEDVVRIIDVANDVYKPARIRFVCDPNQDCVRLNNSVLNRYYGVKPGGAQPVLPSPTEDEGNREILKVAFQYAGKIVCFFRYGNLVSEEGGMGSESGGGFSCLILTSLRHTDSGYRGIAHELGHYFGLSHTFATLSHTPEGAAQYLAQHGNRVAVFDGDGLDDTSMN